jgi:hypothetical protein
LKNDLLFKEKKSNFARPISFFKRVFINENFYPISITMLGTAIKNTVLVTLIIFIFHFMIKNRLLDQPVSSEKALLEFVSGSSEKAKPVDPQRKAILDTDEAYLKRCATETNDVKAELYDFVFKDSEANSKELTKFYEEKIPGVQAISDPNPIETHLQNAKKDLIPISSTAVSPNPTGNLTNERCFKSALIINEYQNEGVMNGGKFNDLNGFVDFQLEYAAP